MQCMSATLNAGLCIIALTSTAALAQPLQDGHANARQVNTREISIHTPDYRWREEGMAGECWHDIETTIDIVAKAETGSQVEQYDGTYKETEHTDTSTRCPDDSWYNVDKKSQNGHAKFNLQISTRGEERDGWKVFGSGKGTAEFDWVSTVTSAHFPVYNFVQPMTRSIEVKVTGNTATMVLDGKIHLKGSVVAKTSDELTIVETRDGYQVTNSRGQTRFYPKIRGATQTFQDGGDGPICVIHLAGADSNITSYVNEAGTITTVQRETDGTTRKITTTQEGLWVSTSETKRNSGGGETETYTRLESDGTSHTTVRTTDGSGKQISLLEKETIATPEGTIDRITTYDKDGQEVIEELTYDKSGEPKRYDQCTGSGCPPPWKRPGWVNPPPIDAPP